MNSSTLTAADTTAITATMVIFMLIYVVMYFVPTIVAALRKHHQLAPIAVVNLFLGWTVIGWIIAFIWSLTSQQPPQTIIVQQPAYPYPYPPQQQPQQPTPPESAPHGDSAA